MWESTMERAVASLLSSNCRRHCEDRPSKVSVTLVGAGRSLLWDRQYHAAKMVAFNWKALENFPLLMYILAAKTLILCLAFAGVKMYQSKKIEEKLKREREEKQKTEAEKKYD
ncbi:small integral membrane protein 11A isoform X1 [Falco naumanni]|uniref:small integral membrane protein 11A isoform X1 n=1 Tax=Falco naumanni TaxID=148594 RepID=UPI001ADE0B1A|nr:small integral membrane protein 11A isoform X1 [Falco naumanni]XP_040440946.1 small integral membrane protein 11A isoform X1 [Falco naumanni]XP_040440947.1 small integral membrane protein 11A isoform X1 [Falco naumanni]XP_040440949.1 small integral membrane protein 11A isoform X1 [Falco naumanni]XP_040440950.1 small integral membrane protein 11A isoform X1 [Falco naumanni]